MDAQLSELLKNSSPNTVLVNDLSEIDHLYKEYNSSISQVDELCETIDPDATPFKSKYEARNVIEGLCKKMEATRTIAMMEKKPTIARDLDWRIASLRVRLATIDWDVEEPHNSEIELELASNYYFKELYDNIMKDTKKQSIDDDDETDEGNISTSSLDVEATVPQLPSTYGHSSIPFENIAVDVLKCLNLSGILWAGRGQVKRSFMFLHSSYNVYKTCFDIHIQQNNTIDNQSIHNFLKVIPTSVITDIESIHTLTLFYLAQAYAHLNNVKKSSLFCHETLQRQLDIPFPSLKSTMEWIKNCLGMSDYYVSRNLYNHGLCTILSCEQVYEKYIKHYPYNNKNNNHTNHNIVDTASLTIPSSSSSSSSSSSELDPEVLELKGEILKKFIQLDTKLMRAAFEAEIKKKNDAIDNADASIWASKSTTTASSSSSATAVGSRSSISNSNDDDDDDDDVNEVLTESKFIKLHISDSNYNNSNTNNSNNNNSSNNNNDSSNNNSSNNNHHKRIYEHFKGLPIILPSLKVPKDIIDFNTARELYLRAVSKIEATKIIFPLDGCVTDHIGLLLNHSKLYHYLAIFEEDLKRKFTMENRRIDMLLPMITLLSKTAYEGLHKNISYELGEAYMTLHDIKMDLIKEKSKITNGSPGDLFNSLKKVDIQKCNEYCRLGIAMFTHFNSFYQNTSSSSSNSNSTGNSSSSTGNGNSSHNSSNTGNKSDKIIDASSGSIVADLDAKVSSNDNYISMNFEELDNQACWNPDPNKLSADELRPFFNGHFLSARLFFKIIIPPSTTTTTQNTAKIDKSKWIVASLKRYEWLTKNCVKICNEKDLNYEDVFKVELQVCRDMTDLLPSKIDRIHYLNENSFSL